MWEYFHVIRMYAYSTHVTSVCSPAVGVLQDGTIVEDSKLAQLSLLGAVVQSSLIAKKHSRAKMEKLRVEEDSVSGVDEGQVDCCTLQYDCRGVVIDVFDY